MSASPPIDVPRRSIIIALIVSCAFFMQQLDSTVIATALPQMARTFGVTPVDVSVGMTSYLLTLAVFIPTSSWIADRYGSRTIFAAAIVVFTLGSVLCGASESLWQFVGARILQAIGGAMMVPVGRLVVLRSAQKHELMHLTQFITIPGLVAPVIGPALGGFITTYASWRWIFYLNIPIGIAGVALALIFMENHRAPDRHTFDRIGFVLSGAGLASLMYGLNLLGGEHGAWPVTAAFLVAGAALSYAAVRHAHRRPDPLVSLAPIRIPTFASAVLTAGGLFRLTMGATPFLWPLMFQVGFGMNAFAAGLLVMACTAGDLLSQGVVRPIVRRYGFRRGLLVSGTITTLAIFSCALFTRQTPAPVIVIVLAVIGAARSIQFTSIAALAYSDVPPNLLSAASTLASTSQQLNVGIGVAFAAFSLNTIAFARGNGLAALDSTDFRLAFIAVGALGIVSTLLFARLPRDAGSSVTGHRAEAT